MPLAPDAPKPSAGEVREGGLVYAVNPDGDSVTLAGWYGTAPSGEVAVPARVSSGSDSYAVTRVGVPGPDGASAGVLAGSSATSLALPSTIEIITDGALAGCPSLQRVLVSAENERFASFDGMLFTKDLTSLLAIPEGKEGACRLPDQTVSVPVSALSHGSGLLAVEVGEGSASFSSRNGMLYTKDMKTLVACPPGAAGAVVLPEEVEAIGSGAFAGCAVVSIAALGFVRGIAADVFDEAAKSAVVALPAGDDYDGRKAVWEAAGFSEFVEPAKPGDESVPSKPEGEGSEGEASGLAFTLLDDYTLSVSWTGPEDPAADLEIPATAELNGVSYRVSQVAPSAFEGRASLRSVKLPASVATVGDNAFANCPNLGSVELPEGLGFLGASAFEATALSDVWLPASLRSVGSRALAGCASLERVVALGSPEVAPDALAGCSGVAVYCPAASAADWNVGLPAAGNHLMPYGVEFADEPLLLEAGQSASLFDGGSLEAPDGVQASYSYSAKPISVDQDGLVSAKAEGASEVSVALSLDGVELARAARAVQVSASAESELSEQVSGVEAGSSQSAQGRAMGLSRIVSVPDAAGDDLVGDVAEVVSGTVALASGEFFEEVVSSGQTLKFSILTQDDSLKTGTVSVSKSDDAAKEPIGALVIPATVENGGYTYKVTAVGDDGFLKSFFLESVAFEAGSEVSSIGTQSFSNCRSLAFISLPKTVDSIGMGSFTYCVSLTHMDISSVSFIGEESFMLCDSLSSVVLGPGVSSLPKAAFQGDTSLSSIFVAGNVLSFGSGAFGDMTTEDVVVFASNPEGVSSWCSASEAAGYTFKSVQIQNDLCTVSFNAQGGFPATYAQTVSAGAPVAEPKAPSREGYSLSGWVTSEGERWDFSNPITTDLALFAVWTEVVDDGVFVYRMRSDGRSLAIAAVDPASIEGRVELPSEFSIGGVAYPVTEIAPYAFYLSQLKSVSIPSSVEYIGNQAFETCSNLEAVSFSAGSLLRVVGSSAFSKCSVLASIELPKSVEDLGAAVFHMNSSLEWAVLPSSLPRIPRNLFYECRQLKSVNIPSDVRSIGAYAFMNCIALETTLPESIAEVGEYAFHSCRLLKTIDLPLATSLGYKSFHDCRSLERASLASVRSLDSHAFFACTKLSSVCIPSVQTIGDNAFDGCLAFNTVALPATLRSVGLNAFKGCGRSKGRILSETSLGNVGVASAFDDITKKNALVILPQTSLAGESFADMAAAWQGYGFANVCASGGDLPMADGTGAARWSFQLDPSAPDQGVLAIEETQDGVIAALDDWADRTNSVPATGYWSPLRSAVTSVVLTGANGGRVAARDCSYWFAGMALREFDAYVPDGAVSTRFMFDGCSSLKRVGDSVTLPEATEDATAMFRGCALETFPLGMASLPKGIKVVNSMFSGGKFSTLPEGFTFEGYEKLWDLEWVFSTNALTTLPVGFGLPENACDIAYMFAKCTSLVSVPDGFTVPELKPATNAKGEVKQPTIANMFMNCTSLSYLPASLDLAALKRMDETGFESLLGFASGAAPSAPVETYYDGALPAGANEAYWLEKWSRKLVTSSNLPDGCSLVSFMLPDAAGSYGADAWLTALTDAEGRLAVDVVPVEREGSLFLGWFEDEGCTVRFDFSKSVTDQGSGAPSPVSKLYGKYAKSSGKLPTARNNHQAEEASWSVSREGVLSISCDVEGAVILGLGWDCDGTKGKDDYWAPFRSLITKVVMDPKVKTVSMMSWFQQMPKLVDVSQAFVPEGTTGVQWLFFESTALETIGDGFVLPASVYNVGGMFQDATSVANLPDGFTFSGIDEAWLAFKGTAIISLPQGFTLSPKTRNCDRMFFDCRYLTGLPEGFCIPEGQTGGKNLQGMFSGCISLASLPAGFTVPGTAGAVDRMFEGCSSLATLPEGFSIPQVTSMDGMFSGCDRLTALPSSFDFPPALANASEDPFKATVADTLTYYAGSNSAVGEYGWGSQNRKLVLANDPSNPLPDTAHLVTFKVPGATDGTWDVYAVQLADADGKASDPGDPSRFGFPFKGWYADEDCRVPFDFEAAVADDATVYGKFGAPILRYEVPVTAEITIDASGKVGAAGLAFRSFTPVETVVAGVTSTAGSGAGRVFPNDEERVGVRTVFSFDGVEQRLGLDGRLWQTLASIPLSKGYAVPGEAAGTLGLELNGAQVDYNPAAVDDVARLAWTVGVK